MPDSDSRSGPDSNDETEILAVSQDPAPLPGSATLYLPGFNLLRPIGEGGMGTIFLAEDLKLEREVAVKILRGILDAPDGENLSSELERFEDEAKIIASFNHPNIIDVHGAGDIDGAPYIVMQLASGGALADRLTPGGLPDDEVLRIAQAMASALDYSHARGIVHRDFKPANILFDDNDTPLLMDFGIAKSLVDSSGKTRTGMAIGTPMYMAPEQLMARPVTHLSDIYSFGLVLYEMVTGDRPQNSLRSISTSDDARALRKKLGPKGKKYANIIIACLNPDSHERPSAQQCEEMLAALDRSGFNFQRALQVTAVVVIVALAGGYTIYSQMFATLTFMLDPADTRVYVNGTEQRSPSASFRQGAHEVVAVMRGYTGRFYQIDLDSPQQLEIKLDPHTIPSDSEFNSMGGLLSALDQTSIDTRYEFPPFVTLASLKQRQLMGEASTDLVHRLRTLAEHGDPGAMLTLWLAANPVTPDDENLQVLQLIQASDSESSEWLNDSADQAYLPAMLYKALFVGRLGEREIAIRELEDIIARTPEFTTARIWLEFYRSELNAGS